MGTEIERKFLVKSDAWRALATASSVLRQGYLASGSAVSVRVRIRDSSSAQLTLKTGTTGLVRSEYEYEVPVADAEELLRLCAEAVVEKRRYLVPAGNHLAWEVDVFAGRHQGLVLAEIELHSEDQTIDLPEWLGDEVTGDPRYQNATLAWSAQLHGLRRPDAIDRVPKRERRLQEAERDAVGREDIEEAGFGERAGRDIA